MLPYVQRKILAIQQSDYVEPPRPPQFRVSSLPYCPVLALEENVNYDIAVPNAHPFSAGHYFKVGTAIHDNYQLTALRALPDELIGDYSCSRVLSRKAEDNSVTTTTCGRLIKFTTPSDLKNHTCPHRFNDCSSYQQYSELEFSYSGLSGHCDLILRQKVGEKKKKVDGKKVITPLYEWHIADFKTTGPKLFTKYEEYVRKGYYPSKKYIEQIETYCVLFEHFYKVQISTYTIAYVCRSKPVHSHSDKAFQPFSYSWTPERRAYRQKKIKAQIKNNARVQQWLETPTKELASDIVKHRPCHSKAEYDEKMAHHFFGNEKCPHIDKCVSGGDLLIPMIKKLKETWTKKKSESSKPKTKIRKHKK